MFHAASKLRHFNFHIFQSFNSLPQIKMQLIVIVCNLAPIYIHKHTHTHTHECCINQGYK